jgi:hypothetical protein
VEPLEDEYLAEFGDLASAWIPSAYETRGYRIIFKRQKEAGLAATLQNGECCDMCCACSFRLLAP